MVRAPRPGAADSGAMEQRVITSPLPEQGLLHTELRAAPRVTLLIRPAKLVTAEGQFICVIRDVSATGVSVRLFHALPGGTEAVLETETGMRVPMRRVWVRNNEAGFQFEQEIDVAALVNEIGKYRKRKLRLAIKLPVTLAFLGQTQPAIIHNLSQHGALIETNPQLALAQKLRVRSDYLPEIRATVRWRRNRGHGLVFEDTFSLGELAQLAALLQSPSLLGR